MFGQYGNFMNDPAANLATQFGQTAFKQGQDYIEQNVGANAVSGACKPKLTRSTRSEDGSTGGR